MAAVDEKRLRSSLERARSEYVVTADQDAGVARICIEATVPLSEVPHPADEARLARRPLVLKQLEELKLGFIPTGCRASDAEADTRNRNVSISLSTAEILADRGSSLDVPGVIWRLYCASGLSKFAVPSRTASKWLRRSSLARSCAANDERSMNTVFKIEMSNGICVPTAATRMNGFPSICLTAFIENVSVTKGQVGD